MSKLLVNLIYSKICGSSSRKSVLICMADRANDDGSGIWVSKARISQETELSRSTVVSVAQELEREGVLTAIGKKAGNHGYTVVYHISVLKINELPDSRPKCTNPASLDDDLGEEADTHPELFEVSDHKTLPKVQVSNSPVSSVALYDKNRPYRTIDKNGSKKDVPRTSSFVRWEANRFRGSDPQRCAELNSEADEIEAKELALERELASKPPSRKSQRKKLQTAGLGD